jgi:hypothetical protein
MDRLTVDDLIPEKQKAPTRMKRRGFALRTAPDDLISTD